MSVNPFQLVPAGPRGTIPKSLEQEAVVADSVGGMKQFQLQGGS